MRRAAGLGAVLLAGAGLVWWVGALRAPESTPAPDAVPVPTVSAPATAPVPKATALPAAPKADPAPFADQDRRDGWPRYQAAFDSSLPAVVFDGLRAAEECSGLVREDLSLLEAGALAAPPHEVAVRQAAARTAVARCGRFSFQRDVDEGIVQLQARLETLSPRAAEARALLVGRTPETQATFCRLFQQPEREPWVALQPAVGIWAVSLEEGRLVAQGLARERAGTIARLALVRWTCEALGDCGRWAFIELAACARGGLCGPERISQMGIDQVDHEYARRVADGWARAAADPAACDRHFFR